MATRNPSPSKQQSECENNLRDVIGETVYSKQWLHNLTLEVLKLIQSEPICIQGNIKKDIDQELDDKLSCFWDITSDKEILPHLRDFHLIPVFSASMNQIFFPRLTEISLGILANLAQDYHQCALMAEDPAFIVNMFELVMSSDPHILIELLRLLRTVLACRSYRQLWLDAIHFTPGFFNQINFILCSSTSSSLLISTISAIETIVRIDDSITDIWCNDTLLKSILEAQKQMQWLHGDEVEVIHRLFYIFSSNSNGVKSLMFNYQDIYPGFGVYLRKVCEEEPHLIPFEKYHNSLRAIVPVLDVIVTNLPIAEALKTFTCVADLLPCLLQIVWGCSLYQTTSTDAEFSLFGLWEDLAIFFGDLMMRVQEFIQNEITDDSTSFETKAQLLSWLCILNKNQTPPGLREAFVRCCLRGRSEVRGYLIFACHNLHLEILLESVTDDN